jgi:hypothetical protein
VATFLGYTRENNKGRTLQPNWECGVAFLVIDAMDVLAVVRLTAGPRRPAGARKR